MNDDDNFSSGLEEEHHSTWQWNARMNAIRTPIRHTDPSENKDFNIGYMHT
jgi:hypothetical protein